MATGKLVVYLDLNVYSRPFDDQTKEKIRRETESINVLHAVFFCGGDFFYKTFLDLIRCELAAAIDQFCHFVITPKAEGEREIVSPPTPEAQAGGDEEISI